MTVLPKLILAIEDEPQVRRNIQEILDLSGYRVLAASSGQAGLELARHQHPDLIVCDVMMPQMDGFQVLRALRRDAATATIPFIFLTALAERQDWRQGMVLGADDYITKPFTPEDLIEAVMARLERQGAYQANLAVLQGKARQIRSTIIQDELIDQLVTNLANPLSNMNWLMQMLETASSEVQRDCYIALLRDECEREIDLLNEFGELRALLTPDKAAVLQRFNLLTQSQV